MVLLSALTSSVHNSPRQGRRSFGCLPLINPYVRGVLLIAVATLLLLSYTPCADAALRNVTIDDEYGDSLTKILPTFLPATPGVWDGAECTGCFLNPDPARIFNNTYKAVTYRKDAGVDPVEFSFEFTGIAVYVFLTLANQVFHPLDNITTLTEVNFTIDDGPARFFRHEDRDAPGYVFQFPAFVEENLEHREHTFKGRMSGPEYHIYLNFDYAIYTQDDTLIPGGEGPTSESVPTNTSTTTFPVTGTTSAPSASTASSTSSSVDIKITGPVAGGAAGALAIFVAFLIAFLVIRRRARRALGTSLGDSETGRTTPTAGVGGRRRRNRRRAGREYPDPEIFTSNRLHDTQHAFTGARVTGHHHITPFMIPSSGDATGSSHSLTAQTQGGGSSGDGRITPYPTTFHKEGRRWGRGRGGNHSPQPVRKQRIGGSGDPPNGNTRLNYVAPQPVHKHRIGDNGGGSSGNTGLSSVTDIGTLQQLPVYTSNESTVVNQPRPRSQANRAAFSEGSGSSTSENRYVGMEESVYAATGVRLNTVRPRTPHALNAQASGQRGGREGSPPLPAGAATASQSSAPSGPMALEAQMQAVQESICVLLAKLRLERERLAADGTSADAMQRDDGLRRRTEALRLLAEEMNMLQARGSEVPLWDRGENDGERRGSSTTQLPGYESRVVTM